MTTVHNQLQAENLEGVISTLQFVYDICQQRRCLCEKINQDCRDLLRPWPPKKVHRNSRHQQEDSQQVEVPSLEHKVPELPPEEELGLTLVEKALAKAERTRNRFHVKYKDKAENSEKERPRSLKSSTDNSKLLTSKQRGGSSSHKNRLLPGQHKTSDCDKDDNINTISQSQLNSVLSTDRPGAVTLTGHGSTKARYTPAHFKAPFNTQKQVKGRSSAIRVRSADKSEQRDNVTETRKVTSFRTDPQSHVVRKTSTSDKYYRHHDTTNIADEPYDAVQGNMMLDNKLDDEGLRQECQDNDRRFCLLNEGKQLSMPSRYNRLLTQNHKLQEKLATVYTSSDRSESTNLDMFMDRLQHLIDTDISVEAVKLRKVLSLITVYHTVHKLLLEVPLSVIKCDDIDWIEVLSYIHKLKFVIQSFASLEKYFQALIADCPENIKCQQKHPVSKPKLTLSTLFWIPEHIGSVPTSSHCIQYKTRKQLITFTTLLYQIQVLLLEKHILHEMENILDSFSHATGKESWFLTVYRALYGMMCSLGRSFPTIVTDTIDSDDDDDDDDNDES